ncbi:acyltransferase family protein [Hydrogenophaga sp.]|uniref:acyltransferase family protein n=1 Tax=Hydrogenophaga sp. TaxID=1904254 RepID=UPI003D2A527A
MSPTLPLSPPEGAPQRLMLIDAFKAVASQLIVLHHLAFYGPMSDWTHRVLPDLVAWFSQDARMAVQVFLVVAGFLAARSLAPAGALAPTQSPGRLLWQRYVRIALPYTAALVVAVVCTELARQWMAHDSLPERAEFWQFVWHALLLHTLLDVDSLSAGVWYVAIDFQLYALLLGLLWISRGVRGPWPQVLVAVGVLVSLFHFNLDADWDAWALYFFGAYGMGVLTGWATRNPAAWREGRWPMAALLALVFLIDFTGISHPHCAGAGGQRGAGGGAVARLAHHLAPQPRGGLSGAHFLLGVSAQFSGGAGGQCALHALRQRRPTGADAGRAAGLAGLQPGRCRLSPRGGATARSPGPRASNTGQRAGASTGASAAWLINSVNHTR